ncbi:MAG TPA: 16S rRNA (uracil(1498)-N(3))-methyltransferase [Bacteroidales bacterium]|nr:16S rRNA (uracil(1498)-N(3))-methyltransferase [Bacteroidales bacterium]
MHIFYAPDAAPGLLNLSEEESLHCSRVLRMQAGDRMLITNGKGLFFDAVVDLPHPKKTSVVCSEGRGEDNDRGFSIHIALAPTKNLERTEWFVEKATEIGIDKITLFYSAHSERKVVKPDRLMRTAIAAMKQSVKSRLPELCLADSLDELIKKAVEPQRFIAWIDPEIKQELSFSIKPGEDCLVLIGPEGDFTKEEVKMAQAGGFVPVSLGKSRLRTETAALVACHTVHMVNTLQKQNV